MKRMTKSNLLPCPFCGNLAQIKKRESAWEKKIWFSVRCITSKCCGHPREPNEYDTKEKAIKAWNLRFNNDRE